MKKGIMLLCIIALLFNSGNIINVKAESMNDDILYENNRTEGLIYRVELSARLWYGYFSLSGKTNSSNTMAYIGYTDISIQRSSDGIHWTQEKTIPDILNTNSSSNTLSDYLITVSGGYYYRACLNHYADNGSGTTQTISNTTNAVWIY
jgi:hypothetical protein